MENKIRLRLLPRPARSYEEPPCCFYIRNTKIDQTTQTTKIDYQPQGR